MNTSLEIIVALLTGVLFSGAAVGAAILGACTVSAGGCFWLWRRFGRPRK